jgi:hypothetical protein
MSVFARLLAYSPTLATRKAAAEPVEAKAGRHRLCLRQAFRQAQEPLRRRLHCVVAYFLSNYSGVMPECFYRASNFITVQVSGFPLTTCGNDNRHKLFFC